MKKKLSILLGILLLIVCGVVIFLINTNAKDNQIKGEDVPEIVLDASGSPIFIDGDVLNANVTGNNDVYSALNEVAEMYGFKNVKDEFDIISVKEVFNFKYYKVVQKFKNIPVYGNQLVIAVDENNKIASVTGHYLKDIDIDTSSKLSIKEAMASLQSSLVQEAQVSENGHYIYITDEGKVFNSYIYTVLSPLEYSYYVVDAMTGEVIDVLAKVNNAVESVTLEGADGKDHTISLDVSDLNKSEYSFIDSNRKIKIVDASSVSLNVGTKEDPKVINSLSLFMFKLTNQPAIKIEKNNNDEFVYKKGEEKILPAAVVAMDNFAKTYDYYKEVLERDSFDDEGSEIIVNIGIKKDIIASKNSNNEPANACWRGDADKEFYFGASNGITFAAGLDIVAHEFTHGVTASNVGLISKGESGALNEAYSDIIGSLIEGENFELGENVLLSRSMSNPNEFNHPAVKGGKYYFPTDIDTYNEKWQADVMKGKAESGVPLKDWKDWDYGGIHTNSGVPNHAAYLMYENGAFSSKEEMAKVWYRSQYMLTSIATFEDTALAVLQSATDMGLKKEKVDIIKDAFIETKMLEREHGFVNGIVKDEDNKKAIQDAQITVMNKNNVYVHYDTKTDKNGEFALYNVPVGEYTVVVEKAKYKSTEKDIKLNEEKNEVVEINLKKISEGDYKESEVVFVLDISASMTNSDPSDIRKQMMVNVIASLDEHADVALVTFAKNANVINSGLSDKKVDKKILMTDVFNMVNDSGYTDNSGTNGRQGLSKALELFTDNSKSRKYIVFFTDGIDNIDEGTSYEDIIKEAKKDNIRILSVGLGKDTDIDETQLKILASSTDGKYYHASDSDDLHEFDQSIFEELE